MLCVDVRAPVTQGSHGRKYICHGGGVVVVGVVGVGVVVAVT